MPKKVDHRRAYTSGLIAKARGLSRMSPFYEDEDADRFFFYGYDGAKPEDIGLSLKVVGGGMANPLQSAPTTTPLDMNTPPVEGM